MSRREENQEIRFSVFFNLQAGIFEFGIKSKFVRLVIQKPTFCDQLGYCKYFSSKMGQEKRDFQNLCVFVNFEVMLCARIKSQCLYFMGNFVLNRMLFDFFKQTVQNPRKVKITEPKLLKHVRGTQKVGQGAEPWVFFGQSMFFRLRASPETISNQKQTPAKKVIIKIFFGLV